MKKSAKNAASTLTALAIVTLSTGLADAGDRQTDRRFVGTYNGFTGVPIYSKLVFDDAAKKLTYCNVQSCRNIQCFEMAYTGSLDNKFAYSDELRSWKFEWVEKDRLLGEFTNNEGETAFAWYSPEDAPLVLPIKSSKSSRNTEYTTKTQ